MAESMADAERRDARDAWRRKGGSARRPLSSFATADEKKARRLEHAERITDAVRALQTPAGFETWRRALELCPDVSALNAALIAWQTPDEIAGTAAYWKRNGYLIEKGQTAAGYITGPNFWPTAIFTARQAGADDLAGMAEQEWESELAEIDTGALEMLRSRLAEGMKGRDVCEMVARRLGLREQTA